MNEKRKHADEKSACFLVYENSGISPEMRVFGDDRFLIGESVNIFCSGRNCLFVKRSASIGKMTEKDTFKKRKPAEIADSCRIGFKRENMPDIFCDKVGTRASADISDAAPDIIGDQCIGMRIPKAFKHPECIAAADVEAVKRKI